MTESKGSEHLSSVSLSCRYTGEECGTARARAARMNVGRKREVRRVGMVGLVWWW